MVAGPPCKGGHRAGQWGHARLAVLGATCLIEVEVGLIERPEEANRSLAQTCTAAADRAMDAEYTRPGDWHRTDADWTLDWRGDVHHDLTPLKSQRCQQSSLQSQWFQQSSLQCAAVTQNTNTDTME